MLYWYVFFAILEAFILKIFQGSMPPDPPRTLAPAARAKNAFGILFSPPSPQSQKCCVVPDINSITT